MTTRTRPVDPKAMSVARFERAGYISNAVQQGLLFLVFGGLAASRATGHVLSPAALCGVVVVAAFGSAMIGWVSNLYSGAFAVLMGTVHVEPRSTDSDPFVAPSLWRTTMLWSVGAAAWAAAGAGLVAVALNGRVARFPAIVAALIGLAGVNVLAITGAARRRGLENVATAPARVVPVRRRAWLELALPLAAGQGVVNAGVAWLLFHSYPVGDAALAGVLTDSVALADALLVVVPLTVVFGGITRYWGAFEIATGRVALDDPEVQIVPRRSPIGVQFMVYIAVLGLVAFRVAAFVLPATPSLAEVILVRGMLAALLVFVAIGFGFVRGACNGLPE